MNVLFINDSTSSANWGDRAAAIALKHMIVASECRISGILSEESLKRSLFSRPEPALRDEKRAHFGMFGRATGLLAPPLLLKAQQRISARLHGSRRNFIADMLPESWRDFEPCLQKVLRMRATNGGIFDMIEQADIAIIHGDGCMAGNARIARAELFAAYMIRKHFKKPVAIVNHTADFDHPNLREIAQRIYPMLDDVVFRDSISEERCRSFCNGKVAADSAFLFEPSPPELWLPVARRPTYFDVWPDTATFDPAEPYICIGGSSLYFYNKQFDPVAAFTDFILHVKSRYSGQVVLTASDLRDEIIFRPIAKSLGIPLVGLTTPVQQAIDIVGNAQAYIGGRWHPSIFALRGGTPIIPISSQTFKMRALAEMSGMSSTVFDAMKLNQEAGAISLQLNDYLAQGAALRSRLRAWAGQESEKSWINVASLNKGKTRAQSLP
jgi:hypothetical protein